MAPKVEYKYQYTLYASNTIFIRESVNSSIILITSLGISLLLIDYHMFNN